MSSSIRIPIRSKEYSKAITDRYRKVQMMQKDGADKRLLQREIRLIRQAEAREQLLRQLEKRK